MATKSLTIEIIGDSKSAQKAFDDTDKKADGFGKKLGGLAAGAALTGTAVALAFGKSSIDAASDLGESTSKVGVVFGEAQSKVLAFADSSTKALGVSKADALAAAGSFGNLAVSLKLPQDKAAEMSTSLVALASDMASFNNVPVEDALNALKSGLVGETEPLRAFGVNLNDAALQAKAMAMGLGDGKKPLDAAAKAQASYALILEQSKTAQGDFARTSGGLANQKKILAAQTEDLQGKLGEKLLPVMLKLVEVGLKVVNWVSGLSPGMVTLIGVVAGAVAVIFAIVKATQAWTAVQAALNVVMAMNPVVLVVLAIVALIAVVVLAYQKVDWFRNFVDGAFRMVAGVIGWVIEFVKNNWPLILAILTGPIGLAVLFITRNWDTIKNGFTAVKDWIFGRVGDIVGFITGMPGRIAAAAAGMWNGIKDGFRAAINFIIRGWNSIEFRVPSISLGPLGSFGGFTLGLPDIPYLAKGGTLTSAGSVVVGDAGPEILDLPRGATVTPLAKVAGDVYVTAEFNVSGVNDPQSLTNTLMPMFLDRLRREVKRSGGLGLESPLAR